MQIYLDKIAKQFTNNRAVAEGFSYNEEDFGALSPEQTFIQFVFTGYIKDQFYTSLNSIFPLAISLHQYYYDRYPTVYKAIMEYAREKTAIKDQMLIAAYVANNPDFLESFPPQQVYKYFKWHKQFGFPVGTRVKRLVREYLMKRSENQMNNIADITTHRGVMRKLIKNTHIATHEITWDMFINTDMSINPIATAEIIEALDVLRTKSLEHVNGKIPFEVMRSNVPKKDWDFTKVTMSPYMALSMARGIAVNNGEEAVIPFLKNARYLTTDKLFTAMMNIPSEYYKLRDTIADLYAVRVKGQYKDLVLFEPDRPLVIMQDTSYSMENYFTKSLAMVVPFANVIKHYYTFSDTVVEHNTSKLMNLHSVVELRKWIEDNSNGTDLNAALNTLLKLRTPSTILLITDEQGNYDSGGYRELIKRLKAKGHKIILVNPLSYVAHSLAQEAVDTDYIYIPAVNADQFAAAFRLMQLRENNYSFDMPSEEKNVDLAKKFA